MDLRDKVNKKLNLNKELGQISESTIQMELIGKSSNPNNFGYSFAHCTIPHILSNKVT